MLRWCVRVVAERAIRLVDHTAPLTVDHVDITTTVTRETHVGGMILTHKADVDPSLLRAFQPLAAWQDNMRDGLLSSGAVLEGVTVRDVYLFGPRIGFLLLDVTLRFEGVRLPGAVLLRGRSCAVLLWFKTEEGAIHAVLVQQPRVATGGFTWEAPAGMVDDHGDVKGQMFKEIAQETGLEVCAKDLVPLGEAPFSSPGLLDETLELFSLEVDRRLLLGRTSASLGETAEGEVITKVRAFDVCDPTARHDAKLRLLLEVADLP